MNNKQAVVSAVSLLMIVTVSTVWLLNNPKTTEARNLSDEALLALIKNDQKAFEGFIKAGGKIHDALPVIDGSIYTIAEGMAYFERSEFMKYVHSQKIPFVKQLKGKDTDIMTIAISKNNPDLLKQLVMEKPDFKFTYGKKEWSLLHLASAACSHKLTSILHQQGKLNWDLKAKDGSTPLTLAAENDCLPMLSYWKEQNADFKQKDGRGLTALAILKKKKDAALVAFAESFEARSVASAPKPIPDFYKKRKIPKDQIIDYSALIEPEDRPLEATETAEFSEFAD
ncbi:MAG: ankyrin repeat domain-containing protein [Bacteriovoracaceae bacterium]|nr:ankyrin repeat domain-containing protein [Bacteriovoracaceae bacterium]